MQLKALLIITFLILPTVAFAQVTPENKAIGVALDMQRLGSAMQQLAQEIVALRKQLEDTRAKCGDRCKE